MTDVEQTEVLRAYKDFVYEASKNEEELEELTTTYNLSFLENAYAAGQFNCFYAGWPSVKKKVNKRTFCSAPAGAKACGKGQLLCQPALFGAKLCVDVSTQKKRNSSFSQCQQKFIQSGRTLASLAKDLKSGADATEADELFSLVSSICKNGFQAKTGMCSNLKNRVASIRLLQKPKGAGIKAVAPMAKPKVASKKIEVVNEGKTTEDEELKEKLVKTVEKVNDTTAQVVNKEVTKDVVCAQCEQAKKAEEDQDVLANHEASEAIDQSQPTPDDFCGDGVKGSKNDKYSQSVHYDTVNDVSVNIEYQEKPAGNKDKRTAGGYDVSAEQMGEGKPLIEDGNVISTEVAQPLYPKRSYSNQYYNRGKENNFEIIDGPVKELSRGGAPYERYNSTDLRITQYAFFPRKVVPSVKHRGDKIIMKMTTGEEIVVNAKSGKIESGAAKDIPAKKGVETRKGGADVRTYPKTDFAYTGDALYIQSQLTAAKDAKEPGSIVSVKALVDGKPQECKVKSEDIWEYKSGFYIPSDEQSKWSCAKFKFEKDEELYDLVKNKCPSFKFPALVK